jgi:thiamine biosynthesis protein ThiI
MDKLEITAQARVLGTFDISIEPDADGCTLFVPKHPGTRVSREEASQVEQRLDLAALVSAGVERATEEVFDFPLGAGSYPPRGPRTLRAAEPVPE